MGWRRNGHLEILTLASRHQHRHCKNFILPFEVLIIAFRSFLWSKTSMFKSFSSTLVGVLRSSNCSLEQLFCWELISTCFWRKELFSGRYFRSFKSTQAWRLQKFSVNFETPLKNLVRISSLVASQTVYSGWKGSSRNC